MNAPLVSVLADAGPKGTGGVIIVALIALVPIALVVLFVRWIVRSTRDANKPFDDGSGDSKK